MLVPSDWFAGWLKGLEPISSTTTRRVYLDHSATTPVDSRVLEAMMPYLTHRFGNPSSVHSFGQEARAAVDRARREVAELIGARATRLFFYRVAPRPITSRSEVSARLWNSMVATSLLLRLNTHPSAEYVRRLRNAAGM